MFALRAVFKWVMYSPRIVIVYRVLESNNSMGLQTAFDVLSRIIEQHEASGESVSDVEVTTSDKRGDVLHATLDIPLSLCETSSGERNSGLSTEAATLTDDGELRVDFSTSALAPLPSTASATVSAERDVCVTDDGGLLVTLEVVIEPTEGETRPAEAEDGQTAGDATESRESIGYSSSPEVETSSGADPCDDETGTLEKRLAAVRNEEIPPYEDTEYLQELYESCDTFTQMSEVIEMDVTSETVRRYMIDVGIHDPTTYDTATEEGPETDASPVEEGDPETTVLTSDRSAGGADDRREAIPDEKLIADGIGLPEGVQIEDIADAVVESVTVFEVQRRLGLERQPTQDLLEQLNLLDLVFGRIDDGGRHCSYDDVAARISQYTPRRV